MTPGSITWRASDDIPVSLFHLSDSQLDAIMALAKPLQPAERMQFLESLVSRLNGCREPGDGAIYRICRDLLRECFVAPEFDRDNSANRSRAYTYRVCGRAGQQRIMSSYWCCARLEPRREAVAQHFLKLSGYEVYIPQIREQRVRRHRRVEINSPLFPAYAFIVIEHQWHAARWSIGVLGLMNGTAPARVPDTIIDEIRRREIRGAIELSPSLGLRHGDRVRILGGPFAGHLALYAGMRPHERVEVLLSFLGSQQRVTLRRDAVAAPTDGVT